MEGDHDLADFVQCLLIFLSTPSGWRATASPLRRRACCAISIHALRVEGDLGTAMEKVNIKAISIHALRVEGDRSLNSAFAVFFYFYPRPPGGGRQLYGGAQIVAADRISIHALRVEGDMHALESRLQLTISIHALRVEGDSVRSVVSTAREPDFYPRPPGGGRPGTGVCCAGSCNFYPRPPGGGRRRRRR